MRLAPTVHGDGDHGFMSLIVNVAREKGVSAYVGDGSNRWPAVHRFDAAHLFRLALENAPAGTVLHGIADEGVPLRDVAEVIGRQLDVPVVSIAPADAAEHFGFLGASAVVGHPGVERADPGAAGLAARAARADRGPREGALLPPVRRLGLPDRAHPDFLDVREHVGGVGVDAVRAGALEFLASVSAGQQPDTEGSSALGREQIPDAVTDDERLLRIDAEQLGGGQEKVRVRLGALDEIPGDDRYVGRKFQQCQG